VKVEKLAKNGQMVQNCYPLSPARLKVFKLLVEQGYVRVEAGSQDICAISNRPGNEGTCAEDEQKFCSCDDDFYVHGSLLQN